ncbi:MAG: leucyl aminopeptidase [Sphingomonadaceae bacterium]
MKVRFEKVRPGNAAVIALPVSATEAAERAASAVSAARSLVDRAIASARFEAEAGTIATFFVSDGDAASQVLLVGVGNEASADACEKAGATLVARLLTSGETQLVVDFSPIAGQVTADAVARFAFGAQLRSWRHDVYRTKLAAKSKPTLAEIVLVNAPEGSQAAWGRLDAVAQGVALTRELVTEPANIIYPESFVERCRALETLGIEIEVLDEDAMRAAGMGALLGVAQGSARAPRLLAMRWNGGGDRAPVAFVGKGVTFDSGGISIKPAGGMEDMKWDMGGAAAVAGVMKTLATRKANANVIGICGLVENMPSGDAQRPGDVVTTMSGQTVEVINTDAEGRLVLCDAITWLQRKYQPKTIIDLATLTGAIIISLGHEFGGLFANDDGLADQLLKAGTTSGDLLWRMPVTPTFDKLIDSPIADIKNVGPREGGSITAAQFIKRFVDDGVRWAHLDIAGVVWTSKPGTLWDKGATGFGVRLLDRFVADNFES